MIPLTLAEVADITGGTICHADPTTTVTAPASVDSREVEPGALFVAVAGERHDGHDFAETAVEAGAAGVLAARDVGVACVVVADTVAALGRVGAAVAARLTGCTVVAVTGSQGKTGTKDLLGHVLSGRSQTVATTASYNNEIGVPLTLTRATAQTGFLVAEMGTRAIGDIGYLCDLARPSVGVELNVGVAHLGEFGTRENIARAKGELVEALPQDGFAVLNADDDAVMAMTHRTVARVVTFGTVDTASVRVDDLETDDAGRPSFSLAYRGEWVRVHLPLLGAHQAHNAAAATAVGVSLGLSLDEVATALGQATAQSAWRMEPHRLDDGGMVLNDTYNANPDSMRAALMTLTAMGSARGRRTVAVLGEMLELGGQGATEHERVGRFAADCGIDRVVAVGAGAAGIHAGAVQEGASAVRVADTEEAVTWVLQQRRPGDLVLVKASRASGLERVASALQDAAGHNAAGTEAGDEGTHAR